MEIAPRIRRIGGNSIVNAYLVEDGGEITIVDAGLSGLWNDLPAELAAMGRTLDDVRSIVLTHGHSDHIGFAERGRTERGWPVRIHELDAALARGEVPNPSSGSGPTRPLPMLKFTWWALRHGRRTTPLGEVATYGDGATLDVPGSPRVTLVPGHTPGSAVLYFAGHDALFVGDALCTYAVTTGRAGPQDRAVLGRPRPGAGEPFADRVDRCEAGPARARAGLDGRRRRGGAARAAGGSPGLTRVVTEVKPTLGRARSSRAGRHPPRKLRGAAFAAPLGVSGCAPHEEALRSGYCTK